MKVLGLMSGTSADGVDAVLAELKGRPKRPRWRILASASSAYTDQLKAKLVAVGQGLAVPAAELLDLAEAITRAHAEAAKACDPGMTAQLVGCHGQTIWHRPPQAGHRGVSWQLLLGPLLAELLSTPVIFDFRAADLALGGQGAPLVPATDAALLGPIAGWRALLNLGGIANLTLIPPRSGPERHLPISGWDCGPANSLLDLAVSHFSEGAIGFDAGGSWASQGVIHEELIQTWLKEPYFCQKPPKSTGRELFGRQDLERRLKDLATVSGGELRQGKGEYAANALATLTAFTAAVVAHDLRQGPQPLELLAAGGGVRNAFLMGELRRRCCGTQLRSLKELGIASQDREALAFATLAWWHHLGSSGSIPSVTGASHEAVLGIRANPQASDISRSS